MTLPFYFAWVDEGTAFNPVVHNVENEEIVSLRMEHSEGSFAALSIVIRNPRVGLLSPGRKVWAWLSRDNLGTPEAIFFGRLVGVPDNIFAETVTLNFIAEPPDYKSQKHHVAQDLKVDDLYEPIFLDEAYRDDPDSILESYTKLWHIDRTTLAVSVSDVIAGEDGLVVFTSDEVPRDSVEMRLGDAPITSVKVEASVPWSQASSGLIDFGTYIVQTLSGDNLIGSWPKTGADIGGGWSVHHGSAVDVSGSAEAFLYNHSWSYKRGGAITEFIPGTLLTRRIERPPGVGTVISIDETESRPLGPVAKRVILIEHRVIGRISQDPDITDIQPATYRNSTLNVIGPFEISTNLVLRYDAGRDRREKLRFTLRSNLQQVVTLPHPGSSTADETIVLDGADVALPVQATDAISGLAYTIEGAPIVDPQRTSYFPTDRGQRSLRYLIALARARLAYSARCVTVSFACSMDRVLDLSCRKSAQLTDDRFPGGVVTGKVVAYSLEVDGDAGRVIGGVTIACTVGEAGHPFEVTGNGVYAAAGYVALGYQVMDGAVYLTTTGDVGYTPPVAATNQDGMTFPLTKDQVVLTEAWRNTLASELTSVEPVIDRAIRNARLGAVSNPTLAQQIEINRQARDATQLVADDTAVWYDLQLKSIDRIGLEASYEVAVTNLSLPRNINLEAP